MDCCIRLPCHSPSPGACSSFGDAIQPSHPLSSLSPPAFYLSQHQGFFQSVSSLHHVAKVLELQLQHQSFQWMIRTNFLYDWLNWSSCNPRDSQESFTALQFKSIRFSVLNLLYGPILTSIHVYWKNHSFDYTDLCWQSNNVSAFKYAVLFCQFFSQWASFFEFHGCSDFGAQENKHCPCFC